MPIYYPENPRISIWRDRIARSKKIRKAMLKDVKQYINFYVGNQWGEKKTGLSEKPVINLIYAHVKVQIPFLYFQNPKWYCHAKGPMSYIEQVKQNAELAEQFLNYYTTENLGISLKKQMRLAILDAYFSFGTIKVGYVADFEVNANYQKFTVLGEDESGKPIYEINPETGEIMKDEVEEIVANEAFFARRVSPTLMLFDPECENYFDDGRYVAQEIVKSVQDVKNSKLYENTKDLKSSSVVKPGYDIDDRKLDDMPELREDLERITLYEIYDLEHDKLLVLGDGHDEFLRDESMPDGIEDHPYEFLRFNEVPDKIYPMSDIKPGKPLQEEINVGRGMIMTHAKRFARKYGYTDETFAGQSADVEMEKVKDSEDGTFFKVSDLERMPRPLADAPLDAAVYNNFAQSLVDFREVMGTTEMERGVVERRKTFGEARLQAQASGVRKEDRKSLVEDFAAGTGKKMLQSMQANLTLEHAIEIAGPRGQEWQNITREQIVGEFLVGIEIGSTAPNLPEFERQELMSALQMISQFPPELVMTVINFEGLLHNLHKYFPLLDASEIINSPEKQKEMKELMMQMRQKQQQQGAQQQ